MSPQDVLAGDGSKRGARALRAYLEYAATGRVESHGVDSGGAAESDFEVAVGEMVRRLGYEFTPQVGVEGFFIDIGVRHPDRPGEYLMGIECDGAAYHSAKSVRDRDRLRQEILERKGWSIHRIGSTAWFHERWTEIDRLKQAIEKRLAEDRATAPAIANEPIALEAAVVEEALEDSQSLSQALDRYWERNIRPHDPERSDSILSIRMVSELVASRPDSEEAWFACIPMEIRPSMDARQRVFLDDILDLVAEYK